MGGLFSSCGVERLLDPSIAIIDLRAYGKTDKWGGNPVYTVSYNCKKYLFVDYFGITYNLGPITKTCFISETDTNTSIITMPNGRRYIIYTYLKDIEYDGRKHVDINKYLRNSY